MTQVSIIDICFSFIIMLHDIFINYLFRNLVYTPGYLQCGLLPLDIKASPQLLYVLHIRLVLLEMLSICRLFLQIYTDS